MFASSRRNNCSPISSLGHHKHFLILPVICMQILTQESGELAFALMIDSVMFFFDKLLPQKVSAVPLLVHDLFL
jgi:hypothetical protein